MAAGRLAAGRLAASRPASQRQAGRPLAAGDGGGDDGYKHAAFSSATRALFEGGYLAAEARPT